MNPDTNKFEELYGKDAEEELKLHNQAEQNREVKRLADALASAATSELSGLVRADGSPVPKTWMTAKVGELVVIKDYTFRVAHIGESHLLLEPVGPHPLPKEPVG